jgi:hypothetical protein
MHSKKISGNCYASRAVVQTVIAQWWEYDGKDTQFGKVMRCNLKNRENALFFAGRLSKARSN